MPNLIRLVLFDIDGTLLWPDGAGKASMRLALEQVYGTAGPIETYKFAGCTDRLTVGTLLHEAGLPPEQKRFPSLDLPARFRVAESRLPFPAPWQQQGGR